MARLSDIIEAFLKEMMEDCTGSLEIQRNELAGRFNCVPSQINYVIDTRFTLQQGYVVESRRGGGGHIRISRVVMVPGQNYLVHALMSLGDALSQQNVEAYLGNFLDYQAITPVEAVMMKTALSDKTLAMIKPPDRDMLRANLLKAMLSARLSSANMGLDG